MIALAILMIMLGAVTVLSTGYGLFVAIGCWIEYRGAPEWWASGDTKMFIVVVSAFLIGCVFMWAGADLLL